MRNRAIAVFLAALMVCLIPAAGLPWRPTARTSRVWSRPAPPPWAMTAGWSSPTSSAPTGPTGTATAPSRPPTTVRRLSRHRRRRGRRRAGRPAAGRSSATTTTRDHGDGTSSKPTSSRSRSSRPGDVGETWVFEFDAKMGNLEGRHHGPGLHQDPGSERRLCHDQLHHRGHDVHPRAPGADYSLRSDIDGSLDGQILQIGFSNTATCMNPPVSIYDNVNFYITGPVATEPMSFDGVKSLYR